MTLVSCAPEGTAARFQNSSPRAAPRGGDPPSPSQASSGPLLNPVLLPSPSPLPRPSRLTRRNSCSTPSRRRVSIKLTGMAPSRRQGQGTRRGQQRANRPSRALQRPHPHAPRSRGPLRPAPVAERAGAAGSPQASAPLAPVWAAPEQIFREASPWGAAGWEGGQERRKRAVAP